MAIDPLRVIGEILGEPAVEMRNPVNAEYRCPYEDSICTKRSQKIAGPYPVCSIWVGGRRKGQEHEARLLCVCPKRFYQVDFFQDVIDHCWPGEPPTNPQIVDEIKMQQFGKVDFVIADVDAEENTVREFVSVEMQAVDITGSVEPAYQGVINSEDSVTVAYGANWANVRKRYISQLVTKGFYHHHWNSRIVAVLQTALYNRMREHIQFDELEADASGNTINFLLYEFEPDEEREGAYTLKLDKVIGTSHSSLMMGSMYQTVPPKSDFCSRILAKINQDSR